MPLQKQMIDVPLSLGLDQKTDVRGLQPQSAVVMQNCRRQNNGAVQKRFGNVQFANANFGTTLAAGSYKGMPWMSCPQAIGNNFTLYTEPASPVVALANGCRASILDRLSLASSNGQITDFDWAIVNQYIIFVYVDPGGSLTNPNGVPTPNQLFFGVLDITGSSYPNSQGPVPSVVQPVQAAGRAGNVTVVSPRLIICGSTAILTWQQQGSVAIMVSKYSMTTPGVASSWSAPATLITPGGTAVYGVYDLASIGDPSRFVAAYETAAATTIAVTTFQVSTLAVITTVTGDVNANFNTLKSIAVSGETANIVWVAYSPTAGASVTAGHANASFAWYSDGTFTLSNVVNTPLDDGPNNGFPVGAPIGKMGLQGNSGLARASLVFSTGYPAGQGAMLSAVTTVITLIATFGPVASFGTKRALFGIQAASKPIFLADGVCRFGAITPSLLQGTNYLVDFNNGEPFRLVQVSATFAPRLTKFIPQPMVTSFTLPQQLNMPTVQNGGVYAHPITYSTSTFHNALVLEMYDTAAVRTPNGQELGGVQLLASGTPVMFDGQSFGEVAFATYPELPTPVDAGAGNLSVGVYQYIAHYETRDLLGNVVRSATSPAVTVTLAASRQTTIVIPTPSLTARIGPSSGQQLGTLSQPGLFVALYRTTANGTLFYRVTPDPPTAAWSAFPVVALGGLTVADNVSDATLTASATAQLLYTTGGTLDNFTPPGARCQMVADNRFWLSGCDDPAQVWPSKALTSGESPGFNEVQNFFCTGAVRAMQTMDDKKIFFVQRGQAFGIEYITGQGPTDTGTQSDWSPPLPVPSDTGAVDQRGTCVGPFGVLFRSTVGGPNASGGIFLLSRDLQVKYVGGPIQDLLNANPVVTSMVVHPNAGRVYITCVPNDATITVGVRLVWDYLNGGVWASDLLFDGAASQASAGVRAAFVANVGLLGPTYHWVTPAGVLYRETNGVGAGSYYDGAASTATWVTMSYRGALWKPTLAGFARFWGVQLVGDNLDPHDFTMTLTFDGAPSSYYNEPHTWTKAQIAAFDRAPQIHVWMIPGNQKAESIQVTLTDATPTGGGASTGQGPSWAGLVVELGVKEGLYRNLPPAQRA